MEVVALQPARQVVPLVEVLAVDGHAHLLMGSKVRIPPMPPGAGWSGVGMFFGVFVGSKKVENHQGALRGLVMFIILGI